MNDAHRKARLNHLIAADYGRPADFVLATGISKARVSQMAGPDEPFGESAARNLARKLDLDDDWFNLQSPTPKEAAAQLFKESQGADDFRVQEPQTSYNTSNAPAPHKAGDLIIHQFDTGGGMGRARVLLSEQPGVIKSWHVDRAWLQHNVPSHTGVQNLAIVTGFGPSMIGMYNPGDPLLVDMGCNAVTHDAPYFFRIGEEGYIKLLQRVPEFDGPGHVIRAISKNPDYPPFDINPKNPHFEVLGRVLTCWRSEHY